MQFTPPTLSPWQAESDLATAYNDVAGRSSTAAISADLARRPLNGGFLAFWWICAIATCAYYWFTRGRREPFLVGRIKGSLAFMFWPAFVVYLYLDHSRSVARQVGTDDAKKRILGLSADGIRRLEDVQCALEQWSAVGLRDRLERKLTDAATCVADKGINAINSTIDVVARIKALADDPDQR